jgi:hypothetical protein
MPPAQQSDDVEHETEPKFNAGTPLGGINPAGLYSHHVWPPSSVVNTPLVTTGPLLGLVDSMVTQCWASAQDNNPLSAIRGGTVLNAQCWPPSVLKIMDAAP